MHGHAAKKMHIFFYNSDNTIARKLQMFNAILRAKIMYGLETAVLTTAELNKLDVFQLRCLRKILKLPTTYINRTYTNDYIRTQLNKYFHDYARSRSTSFKAVEPLSVYHKRARINSLVKLIRNRETEPGASVTFDPLTLQEVQHGKKRVGRPKLNWYQVTVQELWTIARKHTASTRFSAAFNPLNKTHRDALIKYCEDVDK